MDKKSLITSLKKIFCDKIINNKRYAGVWLSDADFGGLYHSGMYILNIKAEHHIESCIEEIHHVFDLLRDKAPKELEMIWRVAVYNAEDNLHCYTSKDLLVYREEDACF